MVACPNCSTPVQADASFCGQCGSDLRAVTSSSGSTEVSAASESSLQTQNFLVENESTSPSAGSEVGAIVSGEFNAGGISASDFDLPDLITPDPLLTPEPIGNDSPEEVSQSAAASQPAGTLPDTESSAAPEAAAARPPIATTQLQTISTRLRQVQTDTLIEIPRQLSVVRIGKPNDQTPPDIDVSGFPDSEVVSRVHANLRVEGDVYYLEDIGSSNGTYVNGLPLAVGNRHRLRLGDRIAFGKGDKVSFIFETA